MDPFLWTVIATVGMSLTAWVGVFGLFLSESLLDRLLLALVALAAGSLVGGAFLHLLPEAIAETGAEDTLPVFIFLIAGFCTFYVLEGFLNWHHHHETTHERKAVSYLVLVSDAIHNFIDGLVIAAAFLSGIPLGLVTTLAIGLHEVPQEIGDFGVLVYGGFERKRALVLNFLTQATVILGGVVGHLLGGRFLNYPVVLLPFAAGNFVYIASSDLIPEIKAETEPMRSLLYFLVFLVGIVLMLGVRLLRETLA
ncbi:ZIP family metal transporter [Haloarchaeobius litoreus]|uniref:ZIP family metal transporter n=1 Tax=Haloarchaeobius litoreus TaxID=755306 RepID=A0ABD6DRL0_9EURY|nr:ZIP family metal transporter [Haloarchaeobius litoreus]